MSTHRHSILRYLPIIYIVAIPLSSKAVASISTYSVNEEVSDTVDVPTTLSINALTNEMANRLRPNRGLTHLIHTSIYVKAGDYLRLSPAGSNNVSVCINQLHQKKLCEQTAVFNKTTETYVQATVDGEVYIDNRLHTDEPSVVVTLAGGHKMPVFTLNEHTNSDFLSMLDEAMVPNIHLVSNNMVITGPIEKFKRYGVSDPTQLMQGWDNIITSGQQHYGFSTALSSRHQPMSHKLLFLDVGRDGSGLMHATRYHLGTGTDYAFDRVVKTTKLLTDDGWGPWHEYGHTLQPRYIQFSGMGEVTTNITSQKIRQQFGYDSRIVANWNKSIFPYLDLPSAEKDFFSQQLKAFDKFGLFWQLDLTFGPRFYQRMSIIMRNSYHDLPPNHDAISGDQRVQVFIQKASLATGYDLREYFNHWGIPVTDETDLVLNQHSTLLPSTGMWENSDLSISKQDHEFGDDVAIQYLPQTKQIQLDYDYFRSWLPEHKITVYANDRYLGKVENHQSDEFELKLDQDTAMVNILINKKVRKGREIKVVFESPLTKAVTYRYRASE
ncbi:M60 family metallopeptidase [Photobacterium aquimaris]|uniref:Peptidase M60 domain-containing protein n=1 Tax=Photobacterium aquimaris TaxID=512643 RepID=A0A2T3HU89_9GAMM|nr:M60 family metallopeptidase [Photobacterium aquimaris]OBU23718.1 hypothetical protein AYY21_12735 [Photobacterium aquimaris]PQJ38677.1 hypothetical protein BTN98_14885 [Photobacterium aquimaris]PSU00139.1 hypothetical protein C0W81_16665 [Photobacterium aquimaris]